MDDLDRQSKIRLKTTEVFRSHHRQRSSTTNSKSSQVCTGCLFQPIVTPTEMTTTTTIDLNNQRKPPSPFQAGLRYLKFLGQIRRQNENEQSIHSNLIQSTTPESRVIPTLTDSSIPLHRRQHSRSRLERTSPFSTSYYAPLPPLSRSNNVPRLDVDETDEISYKTALNEPKSTMISSSLSMIPFVFLFLALFTALLVYFHFDSRPFHCLFNRQFWRMDSSIHFLQNNIPSGLICESNDNIRIHSIEWNSIVYQIEIRMNIKAMNCFGFDILSCLPVVDQPLFKQQQQQKIIHADYSLIKQCNNSQSINCQHRSLRILPDEHRWNLRNYQTNILFHCACLNWSNMTKCFHFLAFNECDLRIPWLDYCLKHSMTRSVCRAHLRN